MVSGAGVRRSSGGPAALARGGVPLHRRLTDKALGFIKDVKALAPDKPVSSSTTPRVGAHAPHHVPREWADRYRGRFDAGYEAMREQTSVTAEGDGYRPGGSTELPPINPIGDPDTRTGPDGQPFPALDFTRPWGSLSDEEQRLFARMAEVYAGFLSHTDHHVGKLLDYLEETEQLENTLIIVVSDNGAVRRGRPERFGQREQSRQQHPGRPGGEPGNARRARRAEDLQPLPDRMGDGVQHAIQDVEALRVQRRHLRPVHPLLAGRHRRARRDPRPVPPRGRPGADRPRRARRRTARGDQGLHPESLRRESACATASTPPNLPSARKTQFYSMLGSRGIWHDGWKAVTTHPTISGWSRFNDDVWELYHTDVDRAEAHNLADEEPDEAHANWSTSGSPKPAPTRRSLSMTAPPWRSSPRPAPAARAAPRRPLRLLPGHRRDTGVTGGKHPQPVLLHRRARRHPRTGRPGRALRAWCAIRRARALRQGGSAPLRL